MTVSELIQKLYDLGEDAGRCPATTLESHHGGSFTFPVHHVQLEENGDGTKKQVVIW